MNIVLILLIIALALFVIALIKPAWPLTPVGGIMIVVALFVQFFGK